MIEPMQKMRAKFRLYKKHSQTSVLQLYGRLTSNHRMMPAFMIIGSQRSGTTSLYNYIIHHPCILPAVVKEVHYFDLSYEKGLPWYRGNFPKVTTNGNHERLITGEATPYYFFHPHVPGRVASTFPSIKLILLLRNPVDRAYSHYQNEVRLGFEHLTFEEAIDQEALRLDWETQKLLEDEYYRSLNHQHYSYLSRGIYIQQLKRWMNSFTREQILVIKSEDFFASPQKILDQVYRFLGIPNHVSPVFKVHNRLQYTQMNSATREHLQDYFYPHNQDIYDILGMDFGWDRALTR